MQNHCMLIITPLYPTYSFNGKKMKLQVSHTALSPTPIVYYLKANDSLIYLISVLVF